MEIYKTQLEVISEAIKASNAKMDEFVAIGITNQRETTVVWNKETGKPIYNAIVWQCRRTAKMIDKLNEDGLKQKVIETTGLIPDAYFSASKIAWTLENVEGARKLSEEGKLLFGTIDSWLIYNLTGGKIHVTDYTNASRTMLFDIKNICWDEELLSYFKIPKNMLPGVKASSCIYGYCDEKLFNKKIPICGIAGDQQAALFGQCCFEAGEVKNTYGTGCFLLMHTGDKMYASTKGLLTTIVASDDNKINYALEGSVFVAGATMQWLRDEMKLLKNTAESMDYALKVKDNGGVYFVPAFTGLACPYWDPYAKGTVVGITRGTSKAHFIRAALESIAFQSNDVIQTMIEETKIDLKCLKVDGGASANDFLMQFQSDISNCIVHRPEMIETTALGAAYLAGLAVGFWKSKEEIKNNWLLNKEFKPVIDDTQRDQLLTN
ncbi:glycerol kinase GlpK [Thomasclavelia spiroformis]|uniref:glycerol kinase GlpK n=1 Tax=Thomasclavelia spiroformis TaxID=29348 RepID=UPI003C6F910A